MYVALMTVVFLLFFRDDGLLGVLGGLLASGPLYLGFGYLLAKSGYQRPTLKERRTSARAARTTDRAVAPRPRPAPTRRTGGGTSRPAPKRRR